MRRTEDAILGSSSGLAYIAFAPEEERDALLALLARSSDPHDALARDPGKLGGQWCVKGTRIPVQAIINNAAADAAEEIATEIFELTVDVVRRIFAYAKSKPP